MSENTDLTYYQKKIETWDETFNLLSKKSRCDREKDYYKNNKEWLMAQARDKYRNLSEEEKNKKSKYGKNRYRNMSGEKKQRLKQYQKNYQKGYREKKRSQYNNNFNNFSIVILILIVFLIEI